MVVALPDESFSSVLRAARIEMGLTQTDLASRLGVVTNTVCFWETGRSFPGEKTLNLLRDVCGDVFDDTDRRSWTIPNRRLENLGVCRSGRHRLRSAADLRPDDKGFVCLHCYQDGKEKSKEASREKRRQRRELAGERPYTKYPPICTIAECNAPHKAKGLCQQHYNAFKYPSRRKYVCRIEGCTTGYWLQRLCKRHYNQLHRS